MLFRSGSYEMSSFKHVDWGVLMNHAVDLISILCVSIISLLLTATSIESISNHEIKLDQDLKWAGIGNLLVGALGGFIGYHFLLFTKANYKAGARNRFPALLATLILALVSLLGAPYIICYVPKVIFGGLLFFIYSKIIYFHFPALLWGIYVEFTNSICPLTYLENWFLYQSGLTTYTNDFINNYFTKTIIRKRNFISRTKNCIQGKIA